MTPMNRRELLVSLAGASMLGGAVSRTSRGAVTASIAPNPTPDSATLHTHYVAYRIARGLGSVTGISDSLRDAITRSIHQTVVEQALRKGTIVGYSPGSIEVSEGGHRSFRYTLRHAGPYSQECRFYVSLGRGD